MDLRFTDVPGLRVGHSTDSEGGTGCTVILLGPDGAVAGVDVRGSAPGTRETDALRPAGMVERAHAICLSGGSAFGLAAADGVMRYLRERGIGVDVKVARVPIVPAAVVFDLGFRSAAAHPGPDDGYRACVAAEAGLPVAEGSVGAGTGATVGKLLGREGCMKGGVGSAGIRLGEVTVGALAVVNAFGDVVDDRGEVIAGARDGSGAFVGSAAALASGTQGRGSFSRYANTTLGVVATDAALTKVQCRRLAELAQDALALAIRPVHTLADGDTVFAVSTGELAADFMALGVAVVAALRTAIQRGVRG